MVRVHTFLDHDDVNFVDARRIKLSLSDVENISRSIKKNPKDTPDAILRMEDAIKKGYYSSFLSQYISEEFLVDKELSFIIVSILQYKHHLNVSVDEAVSDILELSFPQTMCKLCCTAGKTEDEKIKLSETHNKDILLSCASRCVDNEDLPIAMKKSFDSQDSDLSCLLTESEKSLQDPEWNPFDDSSSDEFEDDSVQHSSNVRSDVELFDSTVSFNPFDEEVESLGLSAKKIVCEYCKAEFSNRNNMKQHLIRLVLIGFLP